MSFILTDNAAGSPQTVPITGTGTGTNPPLTITTQFLSCAGGVCDIATGSSEFARLGHIGRDEVQRLRRSIVAYNMGDFAASRDQVRVYSSLPDAGSFQQILIGGSFG